MSDDDAATALVGRELSKYRPCLLFAHKKMLDDGEYEAVARRIARDARIAFWGMLLGQGVLLWQTVRALIRFGEQGAASFPIFGTVGLLFTLFAFGLAVWARTKVVTAMNLLLEILPSAEGEPA